jgi:hypothetical protein
MTRRSTLRAIPSASLTATLALVGLLVSAPPARAQVLLFGPTCPGPGVLLTQNVVLMGDLDGATSGGTCILVGNGRNVDLNGHLIHCNNPLGCGTAIYATAAGSVVKSAGGSWPGGINGNWAVGIEGATEITGIQITIGTSGQCIRDLGDRAKTIHGNIVTCGDQNPGVDVVMPRGTDIVSNNTFNYPFGAPALQIQGRACASCNGPRVENNNFFTIFDVGIRQVGAGNRIRAYGNVLSNCPNENESYCNPVPFLVDNSDLALDLSTWLGNVCSDPYYCPPSPSCVEDQTAVCVDGVPACQPNP